jgi:hypothetical protein
MPLPWSLPRQGCLASWCTRGRWSWRRSRKGEGRRAERGVADPLVGAGANPHSDRQPRTPTVGHTGSVATVPCDSRPLPARSCSPTTPTRRVIPAALCTDRSVSWPRLARPPTAVQRNAGKDVGPRAKPAHDTKSQCTGPPVLEPKNDTSRFLSLYFHSHDSHSRCGRDVPVLDNDRSCGTIVWGQYTVVGDRCYANLTLCDCSGNVGNIRSGGEADATTAAAPGIVAGVCVNYIIAKSKDPDPWHRRFAR